MIQDELRDRWDVSFTFGNLGFQNRHWRDHPDNKRGPYSRRKRTPYGGGRGKKKGSAPCISRRLDDVVQHGLEATSWVAPALSLFLPSKTGQVTCNRRHHQRYSKLCRKPPRLMWWEGKETIRPARGCLHWHHTPEYPPPSLLPIIPGRRSNVGI